jgi:type I restriction enzyme M protein
MNMILHGIEKPIIELQDALGSKKFPAINANTYDLVVANPPYSGTVDKGDLHQDHFPRKNNSVEPITNKSELLFVWLMLDVLVDGGRAAVIVPEGLLFNSSGAHIELRRQLLFDHHLEAVISLPAGVFQPYTGVKTSILIFEKKGDKRVSGEQPRTEKVWFYEVAADGFTLDAKRSEKPEPNDLWDALAKWPSKVVDSNDYYQPKFYDQRWRLVDNTTVEIFPSLANKQNQVRSIHELFTELPENSGEATKQIIEAQKPKIMELYRQGKTPNSLFSSAMAEMLEKEDKDLPAFARKALSPLLQKASKASTVVDNQNNKASQLTDEQIQIEVKAIVQEFAKLDGYNIKLRTVDVSRQENVLKESKSWFAYVREFKDPEQVTNKELYNENGTIKSDYISDYLDDKCIEANDFNLSAGRYKPFTITKEDHEPPAKIIRELQDLETRIQDGLGKLLAMVEDADNDL